MSEKESHVVEDIDAWEPTSSYQEHIVEGGFWREAQGRSFIARGSHFQLCLIETLTLSQMILLKFGEMIEHFEKCKRTLALSVSLHKWEYIHAVSTTETLLRGVLKTACVVVFWATLDREGLFPQDFSVKFFIWCRCCEGEAIEILISREEEGKRHVIKKAMR